MTNPNPATPAAPAAATPGSGEHGSSTPTATPAAPATPAPGNSNVGTVTISTEEFAKLQRDAARARSFGSRVYKKPAQPAANFDPSDPAAGAIAQAEAARAEAEQKALRLEVRGKVRDLLSDDRFKNIPQSTKDLILESPHMLSSAETLEDAMYDIEDKLIDIASKASPSNETPSNGAPNTPPAPSSRETPPVVTPGAPAAPDAGALEDTSQLRGSARSLAALRNSFKKKEMAGKKT